MPIINVEIVGKVPAKENLAQMLADHLGKVLGAPAGKTWVKVRVLPKEDYAESGGYSGVDPIFLSVLLSGELEIKRRKETARALVKEVSMVTGRPEQNIHVLFDPGAVGRIAFGGRLLD